MDLVQMTARIAAIDKSYTDAAKERWRKVAKPLDSLGKLEQTVTKIAGITKNSDRIVIEPSALVIMCGDHGVVQEGVTQTDSSVTRIVAYNFTKGKTSVNAMARVSGTDVFPVDIGMDCEHADCKEVKPFALIDRKVARGTKNMAAEAAMTRKECEEAILIGIDMVRELKEAGYKIIATGEMGIGNTTPSSALASFMLGEKVETVTGYGAGLSKDGMERKIHAIKKAILRANHEGTTPQDPVEVLRQLGGFEIAGMAGLFLGGAIYRIPVVIDGFISAVSALMAVSIEPKAVNYILPSHVSKEPAGQMVLDAMNLKPMITCDMCLGEGTGAIASLPLLKMGLAVYNEMGTFEDIHVKQYEHYEHENNRKEEQ